MIKSLKDLLDKFSRFTNSLVYDGGICKRLNEISFDLVEFKNSKYSNIQLPNREKIIVNMQVADEDFECLLDVCSKNGIEIDELKNATFFEFSILDEYQYTK